MLQGAHTHIIMIRKSFIIFIPLVAILGACGGGSATRSDAVQKQAPAIGRQDVDKILIVDCLLPGVIRKLGSQLTYLTPRRPVRTTASDCEIRGGEYTAFDRADYRTALAVWLETASQGQADSQNYVGEIYEKGLGTAPDYNKARQWYLKAAQQGHAGAQIHLGNLYEHGLGVQQDMAAALNWYRRASGLEDDEIQFASTFRVQSAGMQAELKELKKQLAQRQQQAVRLGRQLAETRSFLKIKQEQVDKLSARLLWLQKERTVVTLKNQDKTGEEIARLEQELQETRKTYQQQKQQLVELQAKASQQKSRIHQLQEQKKSIQTASNIPGPVIEILNPPLTLTRGLPSMSVPAGVERYALHGRVTAAAGLASFTVNNQQVTTDGSGRFNAPIKIRKKQTRVSVMAVDKVSRKAELSFMLTMAEQSGFARDNSQVKATAAGNHILEGIDFGQYHALIIGNTRYRQFPDLKSPEQDVRQIEKLLREKYGFKTRLILNADRYTILSSLNELSKKLDETDNLLIYYAGHGELDEVNQRGHWLPVDADRDNTANWISTVNITDILNVIPARHVMVVADSCYAGTLSVAAQARLDVSTADNRLKRKWVEIMNRTRARVVLTSGGVQPVLDSGGGKHSVFAKAFLETLKNNQSVIEGYSVYRKLADRVSQAAASLQFDQNPQYAPIRHGGGLGEFFFVPVK